MATSAKPQFFHYQNGKNATMPQKDMEITQDMHLKMSKKIAQLTKVIYALNTKNDEHEAVLQQVREQHEEQMAQLLAETKTKIETYRTKLGQDNDSGRQIRDLQKTIQDQEGQRQKALGEFKQYKDKAEQREVALKQIHSTNMMNLAQELLKIKREFEEKAQTIETLKETFEADKLTALEVLEAKHKAELERILKSLENKQGDLASAKAELERKYSEEIANLETNVERLETEKKDQKDEYEGKLQKAQLFYEKELEVLKNSQSLSYEEQMQQLHDEYDKLKRDYKYDQAQSKQRIDDLIAKLSVSEEEARSYEEELRALKDSLKNKDSDSDFLNSQLQLAKQETSDAVTKLKEVEGELMASRERCAQQAQELLVKSSQLGVLEATRLQHESSIRDLEGQVAKLKDRIQWLESAKKSLEQQTQSKVSETSEQLVALETSLEEMSAEKQRQRERFEAAAVAADEEAKKRRVQLQQEHEAALATLKKAHTDATEAQQRDEEIRLSNLRQDLEAQMTAETMKLQKDLAALREEYDSVREQLQTKLDRAEKEVRRLEKIVAASEQGLGSASNELATLKAAHEEKVELLDTANSELRTLRTRCDTLQTEYDKLKQLHEDKMREAQIELTTKLNKLSKDLDAKWADTLRVECTKLRQEVSQQKDEDRRSALAQLTALKDAEVEAAKQGWEAKVTELLQQISELRGQLSEQEQFTGDQLDEIKSEANAENQRLRDEMAASIRDYKRQIADMEESFKTELEELGRRKDQEAQDRVHALTLEHHAAMQGAQTAHRVALEAARDAGERDRDQARRALQDQHGREMDSLRSELEHKFSQEMEEQSRNHQQMITAARMELDRALELSKQKEGDHALRVSELEDDVRHRMATVASLEAELRQLQAATDDMGKQLEQKTKEILRVRNEATQEARHREEDMLSAHREEVSHLHLDHKAEMENMLEDFSQAQQLLKDRIEDLQMLLSEAEKRYEERESRPDDLAAITALQEAVMQRDALLKRMETDKRFYQLELVNRETNFNKVFNSDPKVGLLNPLAVGKKKKGSLHAAHATAGPLVGSERGSSYSTSSLPVAYGRLEPLPNSPVHREGLIKTPPLPPMKKFVK